MDIPIGASKVEIGEKFRCPECGKVDVKDTWNQKYCLRREHPRSSWRRRACADRAGGRVWDRRNRADRDTSAFAKEWREDRKKKGLCVRCDRGMPPAKGGTVCQLCLDEFILF